MARIFPFQPYRYAPSAGPLQNLVTQPYDRISPEMRERYLGLSPYNIVRVILNSDYPQAAGRLNEWTQSGVLARDAEPAIFPYFQEFTVPDTGERLVRKAFIALGAVEDYAANIVYRHERTLAGPKKDRLDLLRATHAHCELIFMLFEDPEGAVDAILDQAARSAPLGEVTDEYGAKHSLWKLDEAGTGASATSVQALMADKRLLIADGHHRYETALAFRGENPGLPGSDRVPMAFVNMHSAGLQILATHRLVSGLPEENLPGDFLLSAADDFKVQEIDSIERLKRAWAANTTGCTIIGAALGSRLYMLEERDSRDELDVRVLHEQILGKVLGIGEDAVRDEQFIRYMRGIDAAVEAARNGNAQIAFLLKPTSIRQVADTSFAGGVMPQKSTDFYPKLLSGLTIYKLD